MTSSIAEISRRLVEAEMRAHARLNDALAPATDPWRRGPSDHFIRRRRNPELASPRQMERTVKRPGDIVI